MNSFQSQRQDSLKRRWQEIRRSSATTQPSSDMIRKPNGALNGFPGLLGDDDLVSTLVPPVTVVLEGRSICQRISLQKHTSYQSLAKALRQMFVDGGDVGATAADIDNKDLDLSNAVPGHVIAYEDMENDLLLAGDLNWKDFVRVAKRIRILPAKANSRRGGRRSA
ncbi:putative transcription factor interactor and regulator AUX-IAA family [Rosa chinensis]|uniref:Auxin-responsive protein n=1 Tax=Rosa chinensis TaxID=74649 RepID=A0A2P6QTD0_ROSCH|nr:auxin-responsive protein IAA33 [Rosa chinensis]PRQ37424.1 putative transcription factor interactor and regulator AUX-IAA family [Rosa chinensis]